MKYDHKRVRADHAAAIIHCLTCYGINHNDITVVSIRPRSDAAKTTSFVSASELKASKGGLLIQWTNSPETCYWASITSANGCNLKERLGAIENTKPPYPVLEKERVTTAIAVGPRRITVDDIEPEALLPVDFDPVVYWVGPHLQQFYEILDGETELSAIETAVSMILDTGDYAKDDDAQKKSVSYLVTKLIREGNRSPAPEQPKAAPVTVDAPAIGGSSTEDTLRILKLLGEVETLTSTIEMKTARLQAILTDLQNLPDLQRPRFTEDGQVAHATARHEEAKGAVDKAQKAFDEAKRVLEVATNDAEQAKTNEETARAALATKAKNWKDSQSAPLVKEQTTLRGENVADKQKLALLKAELEKPANASALELVTLLRQSTSTR